MPWRWRKRKQKWQHAEWGHVYGQNNVVRKVNGLGHLSMRHGCEVQSEALVQAGYILHVCACFLVSSQPASSFPSSSFPSSTQQHHILSLHYFVADYHNINVSFNNVVHNPSSIIPKICSIAACYFFRRFGSYLNMSYLKQMAQTSLDDHESYPSLERFERFERGPGDLSSLGRIFSGR